MKWPCCLYVCVSPYTWKPEEIAVAKQQLASIDISACAPWITLNEQHIMACTKLMIVLGCKISHELDALKWKATGRRRIIKR
jgi:hypothetical protein